MWPFSRKTDESSRTLKPDSWSLAQGERDGFPMIVRMANAYRDLAPIPGYDHHLIISVHLRNPRPNGFPSSEEGDDLTALELSICRLLEADNDSLCVLVVTNNGLRDFIFYTRNVESATQRTEDFLATGTGFVVEFLIKCDEGWEIYQHFSRWLKSPIPSQTTISA
jgi:hypothetical protein